ncbi:YueH family protein [Bacillus sp. PS06]|uniref:YueH family protein n=1 Tax=Bacillus sp. PS06 TaxID=2764176 RepID=UPI00177D1FEC|nr:YueH family protein [Bacillus sp. PS06]MBD8070478.1 YueH family protein [Bacillus sp. PS06]
MKIRKAIINDTTESIYLYENKKEEYTLVAVPVVEWSTIIPYDEETQSIKERVGNSLANLLAAETAKSLTSKITHWVREM